MHKILANTAILGKDVLYLPECHSTNDIAKQKLREEKAGEGSIILTDRQTEGRGQRGNQWHSEPGMNLTFSLILTPNFIDADEQFGLNVAISLGIREALNGIVPGVLVKWPNDIVHHEKGKVGGILIENFLRGQKIDASVVGIGLNINQTEFSFPGAVSLAQLAGTSLDREKILQAVVAQIDLFYMMLQSRGKEPLVELYKTHLFKFGKSSRFNDGEDFYGKITGISDQGKLIVQKEGGAVHEYANKEVRFV